MQKRFVFAVMMAILLLAGTWSSVACEMACLPQAQTGVCCPQRTLLVTGHWEHTSGSSLMAMHNCNHSQERDSGAFTNVPVSMQVISIDAPGELIPSSSLQAIHFHGQAPDLFLNKPPNLPLRI